MTPSELEIWKALNELPEVKKVFGQWYIGDICIIDKKGTLHTMQYNNSKDTHSIWVPPIFDPIRPERSLRGLFLEIVNDSVRWHSCMVLKDARPDLALAKAIIERSKQ